MENSLCFKAIVLYAQREYLQEKLILTDDEKDLVNSLAIFIGKKDNQTKKETLEQYLTLARLTDEVQKDEQQFSSAMSDISRAIINKIAPKYRTLSVLENPFLLNINYDVLDKLKYHLCLERNNLKTYDDICSIMEFCIAKACVEGAISISNNSLEKPVYHIDEEAKPELFTRAYANMNYHFKDILLVNETAKAIYNEVIEKYKANK